MPSAQRVPLTWAISSHVRAASVARAVRPACGRFDEFHPGLEGQWSSGPVTTDSRSLRESCSFSPRTASSGRSAKIARDPGLADGQDEQNRFGEQPAGDELQGLGRHTVQPLRVVDQAEQRLVADGPGEQTQGPG
ncbi:hypothetical protein GCM10010254_62350 [Streptomyces chromofuscus]|nr:hypothetical protein GCM10010254_62350 [Streptomyces chromofuscus]